MAARQFAAMPESDSEQVMCSKCNVTFPTEPEYLEHYNEKHRPA
ncbi:MAG TPA: hypothetical protein VJZ68_01525 [Nitrososphaera sp.]|nr:hypothetical protein [Nitrososphaera sp.]